MTNLEVIKEHLRGIDKLVVNGGLVFTLLMSGLREDG